MTVPQSEAEEGVTPAYVPPALRPPTHLICRVFSQLDCIDLLNCSLVCKQWYRDSEELREGWRSEYYEAYSRYGMFIKRETHPPSETCSIRGQDDDGKVILFLDI